MFNGITRICFGFDCHSSVKRQEVQLPVSFTEDATADLLTLCLPEFELRLTAELALPISELKDFFLLD